MKYNFYAGPAILPKEVLQKASQAALNFYDTGLSILEVSHRSKEIVEIMEKTEQNIRSLLGLNDDFAVLFLTGGASSQFYMSAMNLLSHEDKAGFVDSGTWSFKSIKEAKSFGNIDVVASSKEENYTYIPKEYAIDPTYKYLHLTSNNTVFGTQYHEWPETSVPFVCDMSSDIFSRKLPIERFDLIYAGAQKNLGPAGVTLVIIRKSILEKIDKDIPTMLDYKTHIAKNSAFNTPPVFPIYVSMLTLDWIIAQGGLDAMEVRNKEKAKLLYEEIDRNSLFQGTTKVEDRSLMNVTFSINNPDLESVFLDYTISNNLIGLKGHRSVGGFRASIYNAMPLEGVKMLVECMKDFENSNG